MNSTQSEGWRSSTSLTRKSVTPRSVDANASRNPLRSVVRCSARAASWIPAGHPSVRSCNRCNSPGSATTLLALEQRSTLLDGEAQFVGADLQQRSGDAVPAPARTAGRPGCRSGDARSPASSTPARRSRAADGRARWKSSITMARPDRRPHRDRSSARSPARRSQSPYRSSSIAASSPTPGHASDTAASSPRQNRVGSRSVTSHESQPGRSRPVAAHVASTAVLPNPAGAQTRPTRYVGSSSRANSAGRGTTACTGLGIVSLLAAIRLLTLAPFRARAVDVSRTSPCVGANVAIRALAHPRTGK